RFGLLILALSTVEFGQVVEAGGDVGVIRSQRFLLNSLCLLIERFGLLILRLSVLIGGRVVQEKGYVWKIRALVFDQFSTGESMREVVFTLWPSAHIARVGKGLVDGADSSLCPQELCLLFQAVFEDGLHQAMHAERFRGRRATHQGVALKEGDGFIEHGVGAQASFQRWASLRGSVGSPRFGD